MAIETAARSSKLPRLKDINAGMKDLDAGDGTEYQFKRDHKHEMTGQHRATLGTDLKAALHALVSDTPVAQKHRDLRVSGEWSGFRDWRVKPDLVLIREMRGAQTLRVVRLGSHGEHRREQIASINVRRSATSPSEIVSLAEQ